MIAVVQRLSSGRNRMSPSRLPRPATVLAFAALVIALTGSAIAAKKYLITSTGQIKPSVLAKLQGNTGPAGAKGDAGAAGAKGDTGAAGTNGTNGTDGTNGTNGSSATNGMTMESMNVNSGFNNIIGPNMAVNPVTSTGYTSIGGTLTPNTALVLSNFAFDVPNLTASETIAATVVVNNVDTAVTCTASASTTLCTSGGTVNVPARSILGFRLVASTLAAGRVATWSWTFA
jgi:hypothetical protein